MSRSIVKPALALCTTLAALALAASAQAAETMPAKTAAAPPAAAASAAKAKPAVHRHKAKAKAHHTALRHSAMDMHATVAARRMAQQEMWIAHGLRSGRLDLAEAAQLERAQAAIGTRQAMLERRGHESVAEALAVQHRQDLQDWAIRTGHPWA